MNFARLSCVPQRRLFTKFEHVHSGVVTLCTGLTMISTRNRTNFPNILTDPIAASFVGLIEFTIHIHIYMCKCAGIKCIFLKQPFCMQISFLLNLFALMDSRCVRILSASRPYHVRREWVQAVKVNV